MHNEASLSSPIEIIQAFQNTVSPRLWELIKLTGDIGSSRGQPLYLVGGRVRDLLLGSRGGDLDLVVEGDALALAQGLAESHGGEVVRHPRFGTAKYRSVDLAIDLATARTEVYSRPGALPVVRPGSMETDLSRRDFTINAMAIHLSPPHVGKLMDPFNGRDDLSKKLVRILHSASFMDDATRIMRAIRYEQRLGFHLEQEAQKQLLGDTSHLQTVGVDRIRHELEMIFQEDCPEWALIRADHLGVLSQVHPSLAADEWLKDMYQRARHFKAHPSTGIYLGLLIYRMKSDEALDFAQSYRFTSEKVKMAKDLIKLKSIQGSLEHSNLAPSGIYTLLKGTSNDALEVFTMACASAVAQERASLYLTKLRDVKTELAGNQLKELGVTPGPDMGRLLEEILQARLDEVLLSREEEVEFVKQWLQDKAI